MRAKRATNEEGTLGRTLKRNAIRNPAVVCRRNSLDFTEARAIWHRVVFHFAGHELIRCNLKIDPALRPVRHDLRPTLWWCGTAPSQNLRLVHGAIRDENG